MEQLPDQRQPVAPAWRRWHRVGDVWRNPIVIGVVVVLLSNALQAGWNYLEARGEEAVHEYWRSLGEAYVNQALRTNDPTKLHELVQRVQEARSP